MKSLVFDDLVVEDFDEEAEWGKSLSRMRRGLREVSAGEGMGAGSEDASPVDMRGIITGGAGAPCGGAAVSGGRRSWRWSRVPVRGTSAVEEPRGLVVAGRGGDGRWGWPSAVEGSGAVEGEALAAAAVGGEVS